MKHFIRKPRGATIMIALVIMMILATWSAVMLKQFAVEHQRIDKRVSKIQSELFREDINRDAFLRYFDGQTEVVTATMNEPGPNPSMSYLFRVDPGPKPAKASVSLRKIPR